MATVIRQERKKGINYRIQVSMKDLHTGKYKTVTTTWTPDTYMSKIEQDKAAQRFALDFECKLKDEQRNPLNINSFATLNEYSKIFLDYVDKHTSANYSSKCHESMKFILPKLGFYKLHELKPLIIQNFIDSLQEMTYTVVKIRAKEKFGEILKERRISMDRFARMSNLSAATIKLAKLGQRTINMESANKIARTLEMPKEMLFDITSEVRPYASQSNAKTVSILKHMLSMAKRYDVIEKNYASSEYVKGVSAMSKETPIMDLDDTLKALECLKKDEDIRAVTAVLIGIYMGRRRGEVAGLMWTDIDLDNGEMTVERSRSPVTGKGVVEKEPKSIYSAKTYAMPATLTKQLIKYKEWWDDYVENVVGDKYEGMPYLFLQYTGKAIYPTTIYSWWKKLQKKHGLKDVHYHSLRKTNISVQYASNQIPSEIIAGRAGHANDKVTKQNYLKIFKKDDHKTAEIVDSLFACK